MATMDFFAESIKHMYYVRRSLGDFTIRCRDKDHRIDSFVLRLHSNVLAKACEGGFKEAHERVIDMSEDGPACVEALIPYLYTLEYEPGSRPLTLHVQMAILADKYDMAHLDKLAHGKLTSILEDVEPSDDLSDAIELAYDAYGATSPERRLLVDAVTGPDFSTEALAGVIDAHPDFARDVALALKQRALEHQDKADQAEIMVSNLFNCPGCDSVVTMGISNRKKSEGRCPTCGKVLSGQEWHRNEVAPEQQRRGSLFG